ncbi:MAG TPA: hypothetical protein VMR28_02070 [Candidatus Saccharimonadales bacterium]|nr:hypothetical protein [Candidatus Saccharimonadales bacterium]
MVNGRFEIPAEWGDPIADLREQCKQYDGIEDDEDRMIREGQALYEAMSSEERAKFDRPFDELFQRMQEPGAMEAVDRAFRRSSKDTVNPPTAPLAE